MLGCVTDVDAGRIEMSANRNFFWQHPIKNYVKINTEKALKMVSEQLSLGIVLIPYCSATNLPTYIILCKN